MLDRRAKPAVSGLPPRQNFPSCPGLHSASESLTTLMPDSEMRQSHSPAPSHQPICRSHQIDRKWLEDLNAAVERKPDGATVEADHNCLLSAGYRY